MMAMPKADDRTIAFYASRQVAYLTNAGPSRPFPALRRASCRPFGPSVSRDSAIDPAHPLSLSAATFDAAIRKQGRLRYLLAPELNLQFSGTPTRFRTVQQDDLVVNLSAFEVFFSERRPFFLEGQEVFNTSPRSQETIEMAGK